jgi:hypothetical protein
MAYTPKSYQSIYINTGVTATTINTVSVRHALGGLIAGGTGAGAGTGTSSTGSITKFTDQGGGTVRVSSTGHGLSSGDFVSISGTTNYNGVFEIQSVQTDDFDITTAFISDDATGTWDEPSYIEVSTGFGGVYAVHFNASAASAVASKEYLFEVFKNGSAQSELAAEKNYASTNEEHVSIQGVLSVAAGDRIFLTVQNLTDTTNITVKYANLTLYQI